MFSKSDYVKPPYRLLEEGERVMDGDIAHSMNYPPGLHWLKISSKFPIYKGDREQFKNVVYTTTRPPCTKNANGATAPDVTEQIPTTAAQTATDLETFPPVTTVEEHLNDAIASLQIALKMLNENKKN
jgi:hypothetical protein